MDRAGNAGSIGSTTKTDQLRMLEQGMARVVAQVEHLQVMTTQIRQDVAEMLKLLSDNLISTAANCARWEVLWETNEKEHQEVKAELAEIERLARSNEQEIQFLREALHRIQDKM